jgi:hypothetical protein
MPDAVIVTSTALKVLPAMGFGSMQAHFLKNGEAQITQAVSGLPTQRRLLMSGTPIPDLSSSLYAHAVQLLLALSIPHAMQQCPGL